MASLTDIAPSAKEVKVRGVNVSVTGVSIQGIALLLSRFPALKKVISGMDLKVTPEGLLSTVPEAVAAIIAAGTGHPGDADHEAIAAGLTLGEQVDMLEAIVEATLPGGVGPFVEKAAAFLEELNGDTAAGIKAQASSSRKRSKS